MSIKIHLHPIHLHPTIADNFESFLEEIQMSDDPDNPTRLTEYCKVIFQTIKESSHLVVEFPTYAAIAVFGSVKYVDREKWLSWIYLNAFPDWKIIKKTIHANPRCASLVKELEESYKDALQTAFILNFIFANQDEFVLTGSTISSGDVYVDIQLEEMGKE